ncbi:MAG: Ig-like domain-containing protein [Oscillospiraceae bacterium]|nr:Ig-like domain-containing protein [Oscillospiraceae bacterium]
MTIRDVEIDDITIVAAYNAGGLVGSAEASTVIENVNVNSGSVRGNTATTSYYLGGVVGLLSSSTITMCANYADVEGSYGVGGLLGAYWVYAQITYCYNVGSVKSTATPSLSSNPYMAATGGLIGSTYLYASTGLIAYCFNRGDISGTNQYIGGLLGATESLTAAASNSKVTIYNCYNTGSVTSTCPSSNSYVGGFLGYPHVAPGSVYLNYNAGKVTGSSNAYAGGFSGWLSNVTSMYYNFWLESSAASATGNALSADTSEALKSFTEPADMIEQMRAYTKGSTGSAFVADRKDINGGYPVLAWQVCIDGHDYTDTVVPPTCTEAGYTLHTCIDCGYSYQDSSIAATGHSFDYPHGTVVVAPTCSSTGSATYTCTVCGEETTGTLAKIAHTYEETVIPPTCTDQGYTVFTCTVCAEDTEGHAYTGAYTAATGHQYDAGERAEPTCTEMGSVYYTCTVAGCGHVETETLPALGHYFVDGVCTREGCGATTSDACYELELLVRPEQAEQSAAVSLTAQDGTLVQPDAQTGRYLLENASTYQYTITADHYQTLTGVISGIDETWATWEVDEGAIACYTMTATLVPTSNPVQFTGGKITVYVGGNEVTETDVPYGEDLAFSVDPGTDRWISGMDAVIEAATQCDDVWNGQIATQYGGGDGTEASPYIISAGDQLACLALKVNSGISYEGAYFRLDANLDLNGRDWTPIGYSGTEDQPFMGSFDGNGHIIRNLQIVSTVSYKPVALFGYLDGATVENLGLAACSVSSLYRAAGLAAVAADSTIDGCWVTGSISLVSTSANAAGGIVAYASDSSIQNTWNGAAISSPGGDIGGIGGWLAACDLSACWNVGAITSATRINAQGGIAGRCSSGIISDCYNIGSVSASGSYSTSVSYDSNFIYLVGTGGILGAVGANTTIQGCYNAGSVYAESGRAGGIAGNIYVTGINPVDLYECYNIGDIRILNTSGYAGGLVGRASGSCVTIQNGYSAGALSGSAGQGGIIGRADSSIIDNCYALTGTADVEVYASTNATLSNYGFQTEAEMRDVTFLILFGADTAFAEDIYWNNNGLPVLSWQAERPVVFGEYESLPVLYDEDTGLYVIENITCPVEVRIRALTSVTEKRITFSVEPAARVAASLSIAVLDSSGVQIAHVEDSATSFLLTVGETYSYVITADGFLTATGSLAVTDSSGYLVSIRLQESEASYLVSFESNSRFLGIYNLDAEAITEANVTRGGTLDFAIVPDEGYEIVSVRAADSESAFDLWDGTTVDTAWYDTYHTAYTISTAAGLAGLSQLVKDGVADFSGVTLYLDADLDMTAGSFIPIGYAKSAYITSDRPFQGTFDGQGHTVTLAMANVSTVNYLGLFGYVRGGTVKNVTVDGTIRSWSTAAGVVHTAINSTIENCTNRADVSCTGKNMGVGGIVHTASGKTEIIHCYNAGSMTGGMNIGGIVSVFSSTAYDGVSAYGLTIQGCHNAGTLTASNSGHAVGTGGIIANVASGPVTLDSCANSGTLYSSASWIGGLIARGDTANISITNCYNTGTLYCTKPGTGIYAGSNYVGGLLGTTVTGITVENCYNAGGIYFTSGSGGYVGSLVGYMSPGTLSNFLNNYWLSGTASLPVGTDAGHEMIYDARHIQLVSADELTALYITLGDSNWRLGSLYDNGGYPVLVDAPGVSNPGVLAGYIANGVGLYTLSDLEQDETVYITIAKSVDSVTLDEQALALYIGDMAALTATLQGEETQAWIVTWSSSDERVATVGATGVVFAVGSGTAVITATAGSHSASCNVTVTAHTYSVTLDAGLQGPDTATQGAPYTGYIENYDGDQWRYVVTYTVSGETAEAEVDASGNFTIPEYDVLGDITVSLQTSPRLLTILFLDREGETIAEEYVEINGVLRNVPEAPVVAYHDFSGWYDGVQLYESAALLGLQCSTDVIYVASYTPQTYTASLGSGLYSEAVPVYGTDYIGSITDFDAAANEYTLTYTVTYTINGVSATAQVNADGTFTIPGDEIKGDVDVVLDVTVKQFTVTFLNKDSGTLAAYTIDSGGSVSEIPDAPEVSYYDFAGWRDGAAVYGNDDILAFEIRRDIVFTAAYSGKTYRVTLGDGLSGEATATYGVSYVGCISDYDAENNSYAIEYSIGDNLVIIAPDDNGTFVIPGSRIIGDLAITLDRNRATPIINVDENFVTGYALVTISGGDAVSYCYEGSAMFYVERYGAFAYLVAGAPTVDEAQAGITSSDTAAQTIEESFNVNGDAAGDVNLKDLLVAAACYSLDYSVTQYIEIYLRADVDEDRRITVSDVAAVFAYLMQ